MDPVSTGPSRRLWAYLAVLAAGGLVILSWMVPEQPVAKTTPAQPIEQMSYPRCSTVTVGYGTRSVSNDIQGNGTGSDDCAG